MKIFCYNLILGLFFSWKSFLLIMAFILMKNFTELMVYWLRYLSNFFGFTDLGQISEIKLNSIRDFTLPSIDNWNLYGVIFDVPAAFLEIILNIDEPIKYYQMRHFLVFIFFLLVQFFFTKF